MPASRATLMHDTPLRLFFALWPAADSALALHALARRIADDSGGRAMRAETLHMTLAFLGDVPANRVDTLCAMAARVRVSAFSFQVDGLRQWPRGGLVVATPSAPLQALRDLFTQVRELARDAQCRLDAGLPSPHVTLVRNANRNAQLPAMAAVDWQADSFVLMASTLQADGARYREVARWPLLAATP